MVRLFSFNICESHFVVEDMTEIKQFVYRESLGFYLFKAGVKIPRSKAPLERGIEEGFCF